MKQTLSKRYTEVFAWGSDRFGQLGLATKLAGKCYCIPRFYTFGVTIAKISCGEEHAAFITGDGKIFTMGNNADGRLGIGDRSIKLSNTPCLVESVSKLRAVEIACGSGHTAAVFDNGDLYTWGAGECGALGISRLESQWTPVKVAFAGKSRPFIRQASAGARHTAAVDSEGDLYIWGDNDAGQLGTGSLQSEILPVQIASLPEKIIDVACGVSHTLILTASGRVLAAGDNSFGQLGNGSKTGSSQFTPVRRLDGVQKIAARNGSLCLTQDGDVYLWGATPFGDYLTPTMIKGLHWPIREISAGYSFAVFVDSKGLIYTWGTNGSGELGTGDYEPREVPVAIKFLAEKMVTQVACGPDYVIALGEDVAEEAAVPQIRQVPEQAGYQEFRREEMEREDELKRTRETEVRASIARKERESNEEMMRKIGENRERADALTLRKREVELKLADLQSQIRHLRNQQYRSEADQRASLDLLDSAKSRLETQCAETHAFSVTKTAEIDRLRDEISQLETMRDSLLADSERLSISRKDQLAVLDHKLSQSKAELDRLKAANAEMRSKKISGFSEARPVLVAADELAAEISSKEAEADFLKENIENLKAELDVTDTQLREAKRLAEDLKNQIELTGSALDRETGKKVETETKATLEQAFEETLKKSKELAHTLAIKDAEIGNLNKEAAAWSQVAEGVRTENTGLKKTIEELENRNKKLLESMNVSLYNRAAEYKQRTLKALQNPASPFRASQGKTAEGMQEIVKLTQFAADTVENVKRGVTGPVAGFNPDYVMDKETYKVEEDPKYVKSNYELIQLLDRYDPPKRTTLRVQLEEDKSLTRPYDVPLQYETPTKHREESLDRDGEILRTTQELLRTLGTPSRGVVESVIQPVVSTPAKKVPFTFPNNFPTPKQTPQAKSGRYVTPSTAQQTLKTQLEASVVPPPEKPTESEPNKTPTPEMKKGEIEGDPHSALRIQDLA